MPRIILDQSQHSRSSHSDLVAALATELRSSREFGQPIIREQRFPKTEVVRTTVIWDRWEPLAEKERVEVILQAYVEAEGVQFRDRLALVIGLTVPEAHEIGILPIEISAAIRNSDPVTHEQCYQAMIELGASILSHPEHPELRFATVEEAEQAVKKLSDMLPGSEPIWLLRG